MYGDGVRMPREMRGAFIFSPLLLYLAIDLFIHAFVCLIAENEDGRGAEIIGKEAWEKELISRHAFTLPRDKMLRSINNLSRARWPLHGLPLPSPRPPVPLPKRLLRWPRLCEESSDQLII